MQVYCPNIGGNYNQVYDVFGRLSTKKWSIRETTNATIYPSALDSKQAGHYAKNSLTPKAPWPGCEGENLFSIGGLVKAVMGICETQPLDPELWQLEGDKLRVKISQLPELCQRGSAIYMKGPGLKWPVLLLRT